MDSKYKVILMTLLGNSMDSKYKHNGSNKVESIFTSEHLHTPHVLSQLYGSLPS